MKNCINFILDSKFFISICALCITFCTYLILGNFSWSDLNYLIFVFSGTFLVYSLPDVIDALKNKRSQLYYYFFLTFFPLSLIASIATYLQLPSKLQYYLFHLVILSSLYFIPSAKNYLNQYSLRNIPVIKIFLISYVWSGVTAIAPALQLQSVSEQEVIHLFVDRFIFIFAITLPFDIRDYLEDKRKGLITIPQLLGLKASKIISFFLLVSYCIHSHFYWEQSFVTISRTICVLVLIIIIYTLTLHTKRYVFTFLIDGIMILQLLLFFLFI